MSQVLRDARRYEEEKEQFIRPDDRPAFHLSARVGWMNDPNGFSFYQGCYHMFYQYHPYDSHWGPMHWGHAVSKDMIHWNYLPAALAPDSPYDRDGCFSGSAITMPDGSQLLMYTGIIYEQDERGDTRQVQTQNIAVGDGTDYVKYQGNPVLTEDDLPEGGSPYAFRDPKIWREEDGTYKAVVANEHIGQGGRMVIFSSEDGFSWHFDSVMLENHYRIGCMWECPDYFELEGKQILIGSAQDMLPKGLEYHNGNGTFYMTGTYDSKSKQFIEEANYSLDYGIDFYAPQTILTPDGRRVMIGWMQNWDTCNLHVASTPWFGQMSLPRELSIKDGRLIQKPIREFDALRTNMVVHDDVRIFHDEISLEGVQGRLIDMEIELFPDPEVPLFQKFAVRFAKNDEYHTAVSFRPHEGILKIDRKFSGSRRAIIHQRRARINHDKGRLKLRIILDRFSVEVFVNDGEKVLSATIFTDQSAQGVTFHAQGSVILRVTKYDIEG